MISATYLITVTIKCVDEGDGHGVRGNKRNYSSKLFLKSTAEYTTELFFNVIQFKNLNT